MGGGWRLNLSIVKITSICKLNQCIICRHFICVVKLLYMSRYDSDSPLMQSKADLFGRAEYAKKIAAILATLDKNSSSVVGLYSKWGYGKTSTINMVKENFDSKEVIVIDIEPWNYQSNKELAATLLYELSSKLDIHCSAKKHRILFSWIKRKYLQLKKSNCIKDKTDALRGVKVGNMGIDLTAKALSKAVDLMSLPAKYKKQKSRIEEMITNNKKKVIVFIDDIDRLDSDQILNVFKLIKSVANINGVTYFLAFDEKIVCDAISESLPNQEGGKEYIDKIIQIPIELPLIERESLDEYIDGKINEVLASNDVKIYDYEEDTLAEFYRDIKSKIDTPRVAIRFANALRFAVPLLKNEASMADLISIELIRITYPELYKIIKHERDLLTGENFSPTAYNDTDRNKERELRIKKAFKDNDEWLKLLSHLFPSIKEYRSGGSGFVTILNNEDKVLARKQKRIKSLEYFNRYFTYSIGINDISDLSIIELLQTSNISEEITDRLLKKNPTRALQKIKDNLEMVSDINGFCVNLILTAEKIPGTTNKSIFSFSLVENALLTVDDILQKSNINALRVYKNILHSCRELSTLAYAIRRVNVRANSEDEGKRILSKKEFSQYKIKAIGVIKEAMKNGDLPISSYDSIEHELYKYLQEFEGNTDSINKYMKSMVKTGVQAVDFISQFLNRWTNLDSNKSRYSDLLDNNSSTYQFWFDSKFDASYLYKLISSDRAYKDFKGIQQKDVEYFEKRNLAKKQVNLVGKEQTDEFRRVIAQQFIYLYESKND